MTPLQGVREFFLRSGLQHTYWIAYSGGLDSQVLLQLCYELRKEMPLTLRAIHVNHHLHPRADEWVQHCQAVCQTYDIDLLIRDVFLAREQGDSLEELARTKRYAILAACLQPNDVLLTAHHQDDQAETVLLQLLRGAGLQGLAAMPEVKKLAHGWHARPLLNYTREQLQDIATLSKQCWIDDTSNDNMDFARNYLRHAIFPLLKSRWPAATHTFARSAAHCAEAQHFLMDAVLPLLAQTCGTHAHTLSVKKLLDFPLAQQRLILRAWMQTQNYTVPNAKKMLSIITNVLRAAPDKNPFVQWADVEIRRYGDDLYLMHFLPAHNVDDSHEWDLTSALNLPPLGTLRAERVEGSGLRANHSVLQVRFRRGGEWLSMPRGSRSLKNLFQEWRVPPWLRNRTPLIFNNDELIAVVGYYLNERYAAGYSEAGYKITLET